MGRLRVCWISIVALVTTVAVGCGTGEHDTACVTLCTDTCANVDACGIDVGEDCLGDCLEGFGRLDCSRFQLTDGTTCDEYEEAFECAAHCVAVCARAERCGVDDRDTCEIGCALDPPGVCNEASVAVRECSQITAEAEPYVRRGREHDMGQPPSFSPRPQVNQTGLCATADSCQLPDGCAPSTNTCGPCDDDLQCLRGRGVHVCDGGACEEVDCNADDDCLSGYCDVGTHSCRRCVVDAHCESNVCNPGTFECGECHTDDQCSSAFAPHCDAAATECVECTLDAHCPPDDALSDERVRCSPTALRCVECVEDDDCAADRPRCQRGRCAECASDADCTRPDRPTCVPSAWVCAP